MKNSSGTTSLVNCEKGRLMGCESFCCRLIVRLSEEEAKRINEQRVIEKYDDGLCKYFDRGTSKCLVWEKRPQVCREYNCNEDDLLQVVLRDGFKSLKQLILCNKFIPKELFIHVPTLDSDK